MRYFVDTEFIEDGHTIDLLSIGVVCEDGRELYAESYEAPLHRANDWVRENVLPYLWHRQSGDERREANEWSRDGGTGGLLTRAQIAGELLRFVVGSRPEFWGYYADYDWVVICQLYGRMVDLPDGWPMFCMDLKQLAVSKGDPRLPEQEGVEHHALADARWNRDTYDWLMSQ